MKSRSFPLLLLLTLAVATNSYAESSAAQRDRGLSLNEAPPLKARLLIKRGLELSESGEFRKAMMIFEQARFLAPNYLPAHLEYIRIKEKILGRFSAVEAEYSALLQREPDNPVYLMANYFRYDGSLQRDALEKVARLAPEWAWGHYAKALLLEDREPEKAVTWCGPCREEIPLLVDLYRKYKDRGLEILSISTDDDEA